MPVEVLQRATAGRADGGPASWDDAPVTSRIRTTTAPAVVLAVLLAAGGCGDGEPPTGSPASADQRVTITEKARQAVTDARLTTDVTEGPADARAVTVGPGADGWDRRLLYFSLACSTAVVVDAEQQQSGTLRLRLTTTREQQACDAVAAPRALDLRLADTDMVVTAEVQQ